MGCHWYGTVPQYGMALHGMVRLIVSSHPPVAFRSSACSCRCSVYTCVRVFASVRLRFLCLLAHVVAQRQQRARTGWERHQWCKPTFGSVGENVNSVYALTVFTYSTINSIPKAYRA